MWLLGDHGRLIKWHPLVNFQFANQPFEKRILQKKVFSMFSGEKVLEDLRCDNSLMKTMVDRFGEDVTTFAYDMTSFRAQTDDCKSR